MAPAKLVKISVNLPESVVCALAALAEDQGITKTEALRRAISTEAYLAEQTKKGRKILVEDNGKLRQLVFRKNGQ